MKTTANQKIVGIVKEPLGKHTILSLEAIREASSQLSGETFKMWLYLAQNQDRYTLALSREAALNWGIGSKSSYDRAVAELKSKGYLQKKKGNIYFFYERLNLNIEI